MKERTNEQKLKDWRKLLHELEDDLEYNEEERKDLVVKIEHLKVMIKGL